MYVSLLTIFILLFSSYSMSVERRLRHSRGIRTRAATELHTKAADRHQRGTEAHLKDDETHSRTSSPFVHARFLVLTRTDSRPRIRPRRPNWTRQCVAQ